MKKNLLAYLSLAVSLSVVLTSCAAVTDIENRLDALSEQLGESSGSPETVAAPSVPDTETVFPAETTLVPETTAAPETDAPAPPASDIEIDYYDLSLAAAFTMYDKEEVTELVTDELVWEAMGWYIGFSADSAAEAYSDDDLWAIEYALCGTNEYITCVAGWVDDGLVGIDGDKLTFGWFFDSVIGYFGVDGVFSYYVSGEGDSYTVNLVEKSDGTIYESTWSIGYENGHLTSIQLDYVGDSDNYNTFASMKEGDEIPQEIIDEIVAANAISVRASEAYALHLETAFDYHGDSENETRNTWYFRYNGNVATVMDDFSDVNVDSWYINYRGVDIYPGEKILAKGISINPDKYDTNYDDNLNFTLTQAGPFYFVSNGENGVTITTTYKNADDDITIFHYTFNPSTLLITEFGHDNTWVDSEGNEHAYSRTETVSIAEITEVPHYDVLSAYSGDLKTVTEVQLYEIGGTYSYKIPAAWEYNAYIGLEYCWLDEGLTKPYEYPGDGVDYTVYVSYAVG